MRETGSNSLEKKQKREFVRAEIDDQYSMTKICPKCGTTMVYAFGETYECPKCGNKEYTDFGKNNLGKKVANYQLSISICFFNLFFIFL